MTYSHQPSFPPSIYLASSLTTGLCCVRPRGGTSFACRKKILNSSWPVRIVLSRILRHCLGGQMLSCGLCSGVGLCVGLQSLVICLAMRFRKESWACTHASNSHQVRSTLCSPTSNADTKSRRVGTCEEWGHADLQTVVLGGMNFKQSTVPG